MPAPLTPNVGAFLGTTIGPIAVRAQLTDRSIVSLGSGTQQLLSANPARNYLFFQNLNAVNVGVNPTGGTATIGSTPTITLTNLGTLVYESSFIPTGPIAITGQSSAGGVVILEA